MGLFSKNNGSDTPKDVDYVILTAMTADGLTSKVEKHIADGFRPQGGVAIRDTGMVQVVTRENVQHPNLLIEG